MQNFGLPIILMFMGLLYAISSLLYQHVEIISFTMIDKETNGSLKCVLEMFDSVNNLYFKLFSE